MPEIQYNASMEVVDPTHSADYERLGVIIIGTSTLDPGNKVHRIYDLEQAIEIYGSGEIPTAIQEISGAMHAIRLYVLRLGDDDISTAQRYALLAEAYERLNGLNLDIGIIVPLKAYLDADQPFAEQLASACYDMSQSSYAAMGIIGVANMDYANLMSIQLPEHGRFISAIAARPIMPVELLDPNSLDIIMDNYYVSTGEVVYASLVAQIPIEISPTNKPMPIYGVDETFTDEEIKELGRHGIVTLRNTIRRGWVINKATTMSSSNATKSLSNARLAIYLENSIRRLTEDYIGNPAFQAVSAKTSIKDFLDNLVRDSVVKSYQVQVYLSSADTMDIELAVAPIYELLTIEANIKLRIRRG